MSFLGELGLRTAEQLEASVGPFVALASYKRLLAAEGAVRDAAILGALRCALALGDDGEIAALCASWRLAGLAPRPAHDLVIQLLRKAKSPLAARLAEAECERNPAAMAHYLLARAREASSDEVTADWATAADWAAREKDDLMQASANAFRVRQAFEHANAPSGGTLPRAELLKRAELSHAELPAEDRLWLLRARLLSPNRYARASALSDLGDLALAEPRLAKTVVRLACLHFDALGPRLEAVELDRLGVCLGYEPDAALRARLRASLAEHIRLLRAARARRAEGPNEARAAAPVERSVDDFRARAALVGPNSSVLSPEWQAAKLALQSAQPELRGAAAALVEAALRRSVGVPPFSLSCMAELLLSAGAPGAARHALVLGAAWQEPRASGLLGDAVRMEAYQALGRGERARAAELLREARDLLSVAG